MCLPVRILSAARVSPRRTPRSADERATVRAKVNVGTRAEEVMKPHTLSVVQRCPAEGRTRRDADDRLFREQFTFRVTNGRSDETAYAGEHQSSETPKRMHMAARRSEETADQ